VVTRDEYIASLRKNAFSEREVINKIYSDAESIDECVDILIDKTKNESFLNEVFLLTIDNMQDKAKEILKKHAQNARSQSVEYGRLGLFREQLLEAIDSDKIFTYKLIGKTVKVQIDLWRSAGRLDEYAKAVISARAALDISRNKKRHNPEMASNYWMKNVFLAETGTRYLKTIRERSSNFVNFAPWWNLLDKGNANVRMASDWGGTPYPVNPPTYFIENSKIEIQKVLQNRFNIKIEQQKAKINEKIKKLRKRYDRLIKLADELTLALDNESLFEQKRRVAEDILMNRVAEFEYNPVRIHELATKIARGDEISLRVYLGSDLRVRIKRAVKRILALYENL
jgi:hypothetical protein